MSDGLSRARLPLLLLSLAMLIGGSRFDTLRPIEGQVVAFVLPAVAVLSAVGPFRETLPSLRNAAFLIGGVVLVLSEFGAFNVVINDQNVALPVSQRVILAACVLGAVLCEVAAAQRGLRTRITAWLGLAVVFAFYFPGHAAAQNLFGSVFAAFLVALFVGGGSGLFLGEVAVRRARAAS
ncbi:MAG TPA: hypothetical protein VGL19_21420 [Polyangiaceae bacterium]|jgi:hypothetical protein